MTVLGKRSFSPGPWIQRSDILKRDKWYALDVPIIVGTLLRLRWFEFYVNNGATKTYAPLNELQSMIDAHRAAGKKIGIQILTTKFNSTPASGECPIFVYDGPGSTSLNGGGPRGTAMDATKGQNGKVTAAFHRKWASHTQHGGRWVVTQMVDLIKEFKRRWGNNPAFDCVMFTETSGFMLDSAPDASSTQDGFFTELEYFYKAVRDAWQEVVVICPLNYTKSYPANRFVQYAMNNRIAIGSPDAQKGMPGGPDGADKGLTALNAVAGAKTGCIVAPSIQATHLDRYLKPSVGTLNDIYKHCVESATGYRGHYTFWGGQCPNELSSRYGTSQDGSKYTTVKPSVDGLRNGAVCTEPLQVNPTQIIRSDNYDVNGLHTRIRNDTTRKWYNTTRPANWTENIDGTNPDPDPDPTDPVQEVRINCGGPQVVDADGKVWVADKYYTGRPNSGVSDSFEGTPIIPSNLTFKLPAAVVQTYRRPQTAGYDTLDTRPYIAYRVPVTPGKHTVRIILAEPEFTTPGFRRFNYEVQHSGTTIRSEHFDLIEEGYQRYQAVEFVHTVERGADGRISVLVANGIQGHAIVNAIYIEASAATEGLGAPSLNTATVNSDTQATLVITLGTGTPSGHHVFLNGVKHSSYPFPMTQLIITGLSPGETYTAQVQAYRNTPAAVSALSTGKTFTLTDTIPPTVPEDFTVTTLAANINHLEWSASTDLATGVASYLIYRDDGAGGAATLLATVDGDTLHYDDTIANAINYLYILRAQDVAGNFSGYTHYAGGTTSNRPPTAFSFVIDAVPLIHVMDLSFALDPDGDDLFIEDFEQMQGGELTITNDGLDLAATYDPTFTAQRSSNITISDGRGGRVTVLMTIRAQAYGGPFVL